MAKLGGSACSSSRSSSTNNSAAKELFRSVVGLMGLGLTQRRRSSALPQLRTRYPRRSSDYDESDDSLTTTSLITTILTTTSPTMTIPIATIPTTTRSRPIHEDALRASVAQFITGS